MGEQASQSPREACGVVGGIKTMRFPQEDSEDSTKHFRQNLPLTTAAFDRQPVQSCKTGLAKIIALWLGEEGKAGTSLYFTNQQLPE
ncbi:unnamed protein product [Caretta caretta]